MSSHLTIRNRQRSRAVDLGLLRRMGTAVIAETPDIVQVELGIVLVGEPEMIHLNETFLHHAGTTDVITFDYTDHASHTPHQPTELFGEIFVCVDEAIRQARRFRTTWQAELIRYVVHGILHLLGHDDQRGPARRTMKQVENRLVRTLAARFPLSRLARKTKLRT